MAPSLCMLLLHFALLVDMIGQMKSQGLMRMPHNHAQFPLKIAIPLWFKNCPKSTNVDSNINKVFSNLEDHLFQVLGLSFHPGMAYQEELLH